ncbi:hypothetical protein FF38_04780 [Lucilia cuprina]|uniref:Uncharacterized protein n=1 Tax=Lucilia cuprina TaxID=7375 RepID=A0A0L0BTY8_LUCCU|nr:hypothetical protein CVS40_11299 [Lucilia cuprina]KNC23476.1 hypothetical protein FF38_04780 [Lucilia cuprina]
MSTAPRKLVLVLVVCGLVIAAPICEAKRALGGSNRKSSGGGYTTRRQPTSVTKPSYNTNSGSSSSNSHADAAKLSYPNYNSQPNRPASAGAPATNSQPIGWNVPNQGHAGPPPAYSASNVPGGAKTNMHEAPPVYQKPNYGAAPPSYNQATGTNYGAPQYHQPGALPAGATYHNPNNLPPGATYYNNPSHVPGGYPAGGSYPAAGYGGGYHAPAGSNYYQSPQNLPQGATYLPAGNALPPGAVLYSSPPQQSSSGLGFGSGLAAGAIGGAILGHVLTPTQTRVVEQAPAAAAAGGSADGGHDRIIIINNGQVMNATTDANGVTVINTGETPAPGATVAAGETPAPLAPMAPVPAADVPQNATNPGETPAAVAPVPVPAAAGADGSPAAPANPEQPPAGGIICVPVRVNQTDPNDATKMVEVEQIACYPAPPPPPAEPQVAAEAVKPAEAAVAPAPAEGSAPLAPMQPITAGSSSQQLQQESTLIGDQTIKSADNAVGPKEKGSLAILMCFLLSYLVAY